MHTHTQTLPFRYILGDRYRPQEAWDDYFDADACGAFWTERRFPQRLMLLKLRDEFVDAKTNKLKREHLERVKYDRDGINGSYYGGDSRSWQRYTHQMPCAGRISVDAKRIVTFTPTEDLEPQKWYALVFLHGDIYSLRCHPQSDFLIPFLTNGGIDTLRQWCRMVNNPVRPKAKGPARELFRFFADFPVSRTGSGLESPNDTL